MPVDNVLYTIVICP